MSDKIKISSDEVYGSDVDEKLRQEQVRQQVGQHYQDKYVPPGGGGGSGGGFGEWFRKSIVFMVIFGLLGGIIAWGVTEIIEQTSEPNQYLHFRQSLAGLMNAAFEDRISESEFESRLSELLNKYESNKHVQNYLDDNVSEEQYDKELKRALTIDNLMFYGVAGLILALFIAIAEPAVSLSGSGVVKNGSIAAFLGLMGGLVVALFVDHLYRALGAGSEALAKQMFARGVAWSVVGIFLGIAPGIILKSWKKTLIGMAGGFLGALVGGMLFDPIGRVTGGAVLSRAVSIISIGALAGLGTALIESAAKTGWLKVSAGLLAGKQFILYKNPTYIGSSPKCEIYLFKDAAVAPKHAAIRKTQSGYEIDDMSGGGTLVNGAPVRTKKLRSSDVLQVGSTAFSFEEKNKK